MKIYTRTGDTGRTALFGGGRVSKDHLRVEAYGTVDELNAQMGQAVIAVEDAEVRARLEALQHDLFALGATLSSPPSPEGARHPHLPPLPAHRIEAMEAWMDAAEAELPPLRAFVLPGGSPGAAALHVARTVCRRGERRVVEMMDAELEAGKRTGPDPDTEILLRYLNRLSDFLFVMSRLENHRAGRGDVPWRKEGGEKDHAEEGVGDGGPGGEG